MKSNLGKLIKLSGISETFPENPKTFKNVEVRVDISCTDGEIDKVLHVDVNAEILKQRILYTPRSTSYNGQVLTGLMLVVHGRINENIKYISDAPGGPIRTITLSKLFNTYIVLDERFDFDSDIVVTPYVEDIYLRQISTKRLSGSVMLLLDAVPCIRR